MGDAYHLGGWGMYPTTLFGFVLLIAAVQYLRSPSSQRLHVIRNLNVLVGLSGVLGCVTGTIKTFTHIEADKTYYAIIGVGESLVNVGLGLCMLILARIIMTLGAAKAGSGKSAGGGDLHPM